MAVSMAAVSASSGVVVVGTPCAGASWIVSVTPLEVPPPGAGLNTVTVAVPAVATSVAGTDTLNCVLLTNVVDRLAPFHRTVEPDTNPVPVTTRVKSPPPAVAEPGLKLEMTGPGTLIVKVTALEVPPPPPGLNTVTVAVPALAMSLASTVAVRCVLPEPDVVRFDPFHRTTAPLAKLLPFTVRSRTPPPATAEFGLMEEMLGVCALLVKGNAMSSRKQGA